MISSADWVFSPYFSRRALLIGAGRAAAYEWRDKVAVRGAVFEADEAGRQDFRRYLAGAPEVPVRLLVDAADEEYHRDTVPRVAWRDRQALLKRRAARRFKETGYCYYKVTGRETAGRRDDRVLLSALANPGVVRQWVALLDEARTPLAGISSLPLFSARLLKTIAGRTDGCRLLVSLQSVSGLRQTCFDNGEFRFSRLVRAPGAGRTADPEFIRDEVEKVLRYLNSQQPGAAEPFTVHFLVAGNLLQELESAFAQRDIAGCHFHDPHDAAHGGVTPERSSGPYSDTYFMQQLLRARPVNHYAGAAERRWFVLRRSRTGAAAAGIALLFGSACWSALNVYDGIVFYRAANAAEQEAQRYASQYESARKRLPETPVDPFGLEAAVMLADGLAQYKAAPAAMVAAISRALDGFPSIQLGKMSWDASRSPQQVALVDGRIEPFTGNFRQAMGTINRFAEDLRGRRGVQGVNIVALPLDISSGADLQGSTQSRQHQAEFTLELVLKNEPAIPAEFRGQSKNP